VKKTIVLLVFAVILGIFLWRSERPPKPQVLPDLITFAPTPTPTPQVDSRIAALTAFFTHYKCPSFNTALISTYLYAADQNQLDWRLLPAISIIESSCGQHACPNNFWGWDSCKGDAFTDPAAGIYFIASQLASGNYYRGKTTEQKIRVYNPRPAYAVEVEQLMKEISNEP
jgi:hypothetical protein